MKRTVRHPGPGILPLLATRRRGATPPLLRLRRGHPRGLMLVLVLWITAVMSILAYSVLYQMTLELKLTTLRKGTLEARALARAGLARGFADLRNDIIFDFSDDTNPPFDALGDVWADPEEGKNRAQLGNGTFSVRVEDENRLFNLNSFRANNRIILEKIIQRIGYSEEDSIIVASAIIDYADSDDVPSLDGSSGTEGFAYGLLHAEALGLSQREADIEPLVFPNERYLTVDQLLDVFGVTPELYFGPGSPEAEYYRAQIGDPPSDRFKMERRRITRRTDEPILGLRDYFTIDGSPRLNMNTAAPHVLAALFEGAGHPDGARLAERLVRDRPGERTRRRTNDRAFKSMADIQANSDLASILGPMQALYRIDVRSDLFTLTSTGTVGNVSQTLSVTVRRHLANMTRDESFESIDRARERERLYEDRNRRRRDRENELLVRLPNIRILQWNARTTGAVEYER